LGNRVQETSLYYLRWNRGPNPLKEKKNCLEKRDNGRLGVIIEKQNPDPFYPREPPLGCNKE